MENKFSTIKRRVVYIIEGKQLNKEKFFSEIGMTSANFRGKALNTPLNSNAIVNILSIFPEINSTWLLTGKGDMLKNDASNTRQHSVAAQEAKHDANKQTKELIAALKETVNAQKQTIAQLSRENEQLLKKNEQLKNNKSKAKISI